jgi:hypothetical protein
MQLWLPPLDSHPSHRLGYPEQRSDELGLSTFDVTNADLRDGGSRFGQKIVESSHEQAMEALFHSVFHAQTVLIGNDTSRSLFDLRDHRVIVEMRKRQIISGS